MSAGRSRRDPPACAACPAHGRCRRRSATDSRAFLRPRYPATRPIISRSTRRAAARRRAPSAVRLRPRGRCLRCRRYCCRRPARCGSRRDSPAPRAKRPPHRRPRPRHARARPRPPTASGPAPAVRCRRAHRRARSRRGTPASLPRPLAGSARGSCHHARAAEPRQRIRQRLGVGPRGVAKLVRRFARGEIHPVPGHAQRVGGQERLAAGDARHRFRPPRQREQRAARQADRRGLAPAQLRDLAEHRRQRHVLPTEDVALADPPAPVGQQMPGRDVVHMDEVQPGIDERRDLAGRCLNDDPPGRGRAHVAGADRGRRVDDDRGQGALADHRLDQPLGHDLAALVGPDRALGGQRVALVGGQPVEAERRHRTGVDDARHASRQRRLHDDARRLDVVADDLLGVACPQAVVGGDMDQAAAPGHRRRDRVRIAQVAADHLAGKAGEIGARAAAANQRPHPVTGTRKGARHRRADKSGGAGHEDRFGHAVSRLERGGP